ncbi:uncharacterized protein LOC120120131 [Hibiscus syriacus]|uniref:uncharacterized protein LOC120120131 n=1 Tax=Hibiscus syriacus TaxID=106335 RepID=UPI001920F8A2|nr:uncharacterized protein LOC120120131 [Hibiscus syriacus]
MQKTGTTEVPEQVALEEEETLPSWWAGQKAELEGRIQTLEEGMTENRGYLQRILQLVNQAAEEKDSPKSVKNQPPAEEKQNKSEGKVPCLITVLSENEKYTFQPNEPGILASKPVGFTGPPIFNQKMQEEKLMGSSSESKGGDEHVDTRNYCKNPFGNPSSVLPRPKVELPLFEGNNPRGWVRKCQKFFNLFGIHEEQKLEIAAMYLVGKAETWFDEYIMQKYRVTWHEFEADLCHRFCDRNYSDIIEEFNKLMQKGSVEEYQEKFEELRPYLLQQNMQLGENYFVSSFISGLKEELKHKVKVLEPKNLSEAYRQAKLYELANEIEGKKYKSPSKFLSYTASNSQQNSGNRSFLPKSVPPNTNQKQNLLDYRRANNLCFKCGEKFVPGHQCKVRQLNCMEEEEPTDSVVQELTEEENREVEDQAKETLEISINAITESVGHTTLRIQGFIKGKPINVLIDSGSTHSFVTPQWAKEGVELVHTQPLVITVANGEKLFSTARSNKVSWKMQGYDFQHDFRVLSLGGSDMVLGVDWMEVFSPIMMDFKTKTISFEKDGETVVIKGSQKLPLIRSITGEKLQKLAEKDTELSGELYLLSDEVEDNLVPLPLQELLEEFKEVFEEPKGMLPSRQHDHAIVLKQGTQPVNLRPYRFAHHHKAEVEKQITEMLSSSIIQVSKSPFASPCLLIKKKDGTWRFCVDYRKLNSATVKNKFPIPIVEDLLDKLNGAVFFSKIDLRSGYWQIRIKEEDIHKTAFRTHQGHYEFKVMPFGLTNAPATFQALMNDLFGAYLRKLYAKRSKCFFGQQQVEYLGHLISADGVATDLNKIKAMQQWPLPKNLKALRGFLGLTGYYRKFIRGYGELSKPLTNMLKKDGFCWSEEAKTAFEKLKKVMCNAPVLALPNFEQKFFLETDASSKWIGAVLSQAGRHI